MLSEKIITDIEEYGLRTALKNLKKQGESIIKDISENHDTEDIVIVKYTPLCRDIARYIVKDVIIDESSKEPDDSQGYSWDALCKYKNKTYCYHDSIYSGVVYDDFQDEELVAAYDIVEYEFEAVEHMYNKMIDKLRKAFSEHLQSLVMCDNIECYEQYDALDDFDDWVRTAKVGDTYTYDEQSYTVTDFNEYEED